MAPLFGGSNPLARPQLFHGFTRVKTSTTSKPQLQRLEALRSLLSGVNAAFTARRKPADHQGLGAAKLSCIRVAKSIYQQC
ncbi:hypothetical [Prochlorococcus marinus str. MIT 9313]|uniref:Uncharacterized protein n=1 Tax=Prochlorococcus marinus (strain MIT 9313) TaxID=74547 RepID=Q7V8L7_PROMM|nr:hypothetical [Prochlorococcus marinus str. MIT 9313]